MSALTPLETLFDMTEGAPAPLSPSLQALYGELRFPASLGNQYVIANFVTSLDGVVALENGGGGSISGHNKHDRAVMGILRACASAIIVGAGTLRPDANHLWTAAAVHPPLAGAYAEARRALGYSEPPLNVIVTASGDLDPGFRVFRTGEVPVLVVTTTRGKQRISEKGMPERVMVVAAQEEGPLPARSILESVGEHAAGPLILLEGGPQLMGAFFAEQRINELFLTLSPQAAGRDDESRRPGLVEGQRLAPDNPRWGDLLSVKRTGSHLFLRYRWSRQER